MKTAIDLAKKMYKEPEVNWLSDLELINLHSIFTPIYRMNNNISTLNKLVSYIIYAYSNESSWLRNKGDRYDNKIKILKGLEADYESVFFIEIASNQNDVVNGVIGEYLIDQTTWKWRTIMTSLDYHSNMIRFVGQNTDNEKKTDRINKEGNKHTLTEEYDIDTISKVNKQKGELLELAIKARERADKLLSEIETEFMVLAEAVQQDFGFSMTSEKTINYLSWEERIRKRKKEQV